MTNFRTDIPPDSLRIETIGFFDRSKYPGLGEGFCVRFYERVSMDRLITLSSRSLKLLRLLDLNERILREQSGISLEDFLAEILQKMGVTVEPVHKSIDEPAKSVPIV